MSPRKSQKKGKHKTIGIEAIVKPGVESLYVRGTWMRKLEALDKGKRKRIKKSYSKRKY